MSHVFDKNPWRRTNIRFLTECEDLWDSKGKLKYSYMELVGETGEDMYHLLSSRLHSPKQFIGVDQEREIICQHRFKGVPWATVRADGYAKAKLLADFSKERRIAHGLTAYPLAVYGFDDRTNVANAKWWDSEASQLPAIVDRTLNQSKVCAIILNNTLDRNKLDAQEALRTHTERLCEVFRPWRLTPERVLGRNLKHLSRVVNKWEGWAGGYEIYHSADHILRMATIRLEFHKGRVKVWKQ